MARPRSARISRSGPVVLRLTSYRQPDPLRQTPCRAPVRSQTPKRAEAPCVTILRDTAAEPVFFTLTLTLPLPPSINHQYATVQGRRLLSSASRRFKTHVGQEVLCLLAARRQTTPSVQGLNRLRLA